jgi:hypothetical protein
MQDLSDLIKNIVGLSAITLPISHAFCTITNYAYNKYYVENEETTLFKIAKNKENIGSAFTLGATVGIAYPIAIYASEKLQDTFLANFDSFVLSYISNFFY